jgi:hypothetical protein
MFSLEKRSEDVDNSRNFSSFANGNFLTAQTRLLHFKIKHQFHSIKV